jgi:UDP-N-acetylmuramate dehydrogenase
MGVTDLSLRAVSDPVIRIRSSKLPDPKVIGNAGSFFKNPIVPREQFEPLFVQHPGMPHWPQRDGAQKVPAGWLIEACGWKGKRNGHVGVHERQALVLVNYGGATGAEVWQLALEIQASVRDRFGIELSPKSI